IATYNGLYPTLGRWNFRPQRPVSLRYVAGWTSAMHEAGPGATFEEVAEIFKRSPEFAEDARLPPGEGWSGDEARTDGGLTMSGKRRSSGQRTRMVVEALRTAPPGTSLWKAIEAAKVPLSYAGALRMLERLDGKQLAEMGFDPSLAKQLGRGGFTGL